MGAYLPLLIFAALVVVGVIGAIAWKIQMRRAEKRRWGAD